jgi:uncharacterized protein YdeI (YjbR/CyaY-like superfamily)
MLIFRKEGWSMEKHKGFEAVIAKSRKAWRQWLAKNHKKEKFVWLIIFHKGCSTKSVYYPEAVEEALCFGWIDSKPNKRDEESFYLSFAKRSPKSKWSKINRERVEKLTEQGLITPAGQEMIDLAKASGTWEALTIIDNETMPEDLQKKFDRNKTAFKNFKAFPPSSRKIILHWISEAKRPETRKTRIDETVRLAKENIRANHYRS